MIYDAVSLVEERTHQLFVFVTDCQNKPHYKRENAFSFLKMKKVNTGQNIQEQKCKK